MFAIKRAELEVTEAVFNVKPEAVSAKVRNFNVSPSPYEPSWCALNSLSLTEYSPVSWSYSYISESFAATGIAM